MRSDGPAPNRAAEVGFTQSIQRVKTLFVLAPSLTTRTWEEEALELVNELMKTLSIQIDDWLSSPAIQAMDALEERGYLRLLLHAAQQQDSGLSAQEEVLASLSLLGPQWYKPTRDKSKSANNLTSGQKIRACFGERDGRLYDERLQHQLEAQNNLREARRRAGQLGNQRRWGKQHANESQERVAKRSQVRSQTDGQLTSGSKSVVNQTNGTWLYSKYEEFLQRWPADKRGVDLGAQVWITLVDSGEITEASLHEVFEGLERWQASELWKKDNGKYIPAIANPQATGWLQKRAWKDHPKAAEEDF